MTMLEKKRKLASQGKSHTTDASTLRGGSPMPTTPSQIPRVEDDKLFLLFKKGEWDQAQTVK